MSRTLKDPDLERERSAYASGHRLVGGVDEVGRGALAGPVSVGIVVLDMAAGAPDLEGVRDSKLLSAIARERLAPLIRERVAGYGVGHCEADEIDELGMSAALRQAALRAWAALAPQVRPSWLILDGSHNWLADPARREPPRVGIEPCIKADMRCVSVAAASVLAKVERDALMGKLDEQFPGYSWGQNKGYGTGAHRSAILEHGPTPFHRRSWNLTGERK